MDLTAGTVRCPAGVVAALPQAGSPERTASFGGSCASCPLAARCTSAKSGRTISVARYEAELTRARQAQQDPAWQADYRANRPEVERKIGYLMRRRHGGRRARVRGQSKIAADFALLAAAVNLARFGVLQLVSTGTSGWTVATR